jgi:CheY-like chemotaxis protein
MRASRVLIVDDDHDNREAYRMLLEGSGYEVSEAGNGAAALRDAATAMPSAVITDIAMPGTVSAADVCRYFNEHGVPVIALTGFTNDSEEVKQVERDCAKVLIKPLMPDVLCQELARVLTTTLPTCR